MWFVVGLPVFLYAAGWRFVEVGGFLAAWTIAYGSIQAVAPRLVTRSADGLSREVPNARLWAGLLVAVPLVLAVLLQRPGLWQPDLVMVAGLSLFALPFATTIPELLVVLALLAIGSGLNRPPVFGLHRRLGWSRVVPGQRDRHRRELLHVLPDGTGHAGRQRHVPDLAALGKCETQLRPHHLDLPPDVDDFLLKVDVVR